MAKPVVGVFSTLPKLKHVLAEKLPEINFLELRSDLQEALAINKVKVLVADFDLLKNVLYELPETVKWIQGTWAGAEKFLEGYDHDRKIHCMVTRFSGPYFGTMMAEYVISNLVSMERNFFSVRKNQETQVWNKTERISYYRVIRDMKIGVLGIGAIGKHVASALKLLGAAQIWGLVTKIPEEKEPFIDFYRTTSEITDILKNCDVIVNLLPHTPKTRGLLNISNLSVCKEMVFINVGRGSIISEADLVAALNKKYLLSAVLDVFNEEPLAKSSPLWNMEQVLITPHVSAVTRSQDVAEVFAQNWALWKDGKALNYILNFSKGY